MTVAVPRADRRAFSEVSELQPVGPGRFDAEVDPAWTIGGKPNGGYLLAMLGRAATWNSTHPHVIAASAHAGRPVLRRTATPSGPRAGAAGIRRSVGHAREGGPRSAGDHAVAGLLASASHQPQSAVSSNKAVSRRGTLGRTVKGVSELRR